MPEKPNLSESGKHSGKGKPVKLPPVHWQVHLPFSGHGTAATQELQKQKRDRVFDARFLV